MTFSRTIGLLFCLIAGTSSAADRPNIIFFLADDQRWDQLGCAGHPILETPHVDELAKDGVRFDNMFVTTSICAASRATFFTGLYERSHRYTFRTVPLAKQVTDQSYPVQLRANGYHTGFIGKFGVAVESGVKEQMFDYFHPLNRSPYFKKRPDGERRHITQMCGDRAIEFLRQRPTDQPFCLSISFNAPHAEDNDKADHFPSPRIMDGKYDDIEIPQPRYSDDEIYNRHPEFLKKSLNRERYFWRWDTPEKYQRNMRGYYRMISGIDHVVGRVREELDKLELDDNTVIIYAGDNGYYLGQRGFAGKWSHYEESLRVPLVIYDPRSARPGKSTVNSAMVLNLDVAPTILALADVDVPQQYQGASLADLTHGETPADWRRDFFCEHLMQFPDRGGKYPEGIPKWEGVRDQRYVYARYFEQDPVYEYLHDLQSDPDQLTNLAGNKEHAELLQRMRSRCDSLRDACGGAFRPEDFPLAGSQRRRAEPRSAARKEAAPKPTEKPNVVMIISDDQSWTDYSFMGHPVIETPRLDQLARESATFPRGYVPIALCRPSLATMITGLYPSQHRITGNDPAIPAGMAPAAARRDRNYLQLKDSLIANIERVPTLPRLLAQHGYSSFQAGKWWEGPAARGGFTQGMTHGDPQRGGRHGDEGLKIGRQGMQPVFDFIDQQKQPFFIWYAPFLPHTPHNPPPRLFKKYQAEGRDPALAKYYAMCEWFDETCGQLLDHLEKSGHADNTIVVYVTDNGWIQRTRQTPVGEGWKYSFAPRSKQSPNEGGTRTPIMIRWPKQIAPKQFPQVTVSSIDLMPTVLAACGIDIPDGLPGQSLLPVCQGKPLQREAIFGESFAHDVADIEDPQQSLLYRWCIRGPWKLIKTYDGKLGRYRAAHGDRTERLQLFQLLEDPHEERNLAEQQPQIVQELEQLIQAEFEATDTPPER